MKRAAKKKKIIAIAAIILMIIAAIMIIYENTTVGVTRYTVSDEDIPIGFDSFKIAQFSDFHNADFNGNDCILEILKNEKPDIIAITGDLVDSRHTDIEISLDFIRKASEIAPCFYVTGNHEGALNNNYKQLEEGLLALGVNVLHNQSIALDKNGESLTIAGIDDPNFYSHEGGMFDFTQDIIGAEIDSLQLGDTYTVLLSHRPEAFEVYEKKNVDLVLSGHAHGGQVRLPLIGGIVAPGQGFFPKYDGGIYIKNGTSMIVSRGIGNSIIPVRVNNMPEIVIVELKSEGD